MWKFICMDAIFYCQSCDPWSVYILLELSNSYDTYHNDLSRYHAQSSLINNLAMDAVAECGAIYSDTTSICGHCSDIAGPSQHCDIRIQGCACPGGQLEGHNGTCIPIDECPCQSPFDDQLYIASGGTTEVNCTIWYVNLISQLSLRWRHNEHDCVSNHQRFDCLLNRLFRSRSKKTSKLRVTGLCVGNSPGTGEFPAQRASTAENVSIWWRHHDSAFMNDDSQYKIKHGVFVIPRHFSKYIFWVLYIQTYIWLMSQWTFHNICTLIYSNDPIV